MPKLGLGLSLPQTRVTSSTPAPVSGMSLWLKADAGVTLSGSDVTAWADQSGNGKNGTADNGYPTFVSSAINGKPAIEFNGIDARITGPEPITSLPATVIIVAKHLADREIGVMYEQFGEGDNTTFYRWTGNGELRIFNGTDLTSINTTGLDFAIFGAVINGVNSEIYIHGSLDSSGNSGDLTPSGNYYLAHWVLGNTYTNMQIAEVIVYNQVLTTPERQQVEAYLINKYNLTPPPITTSKAFNSSGVQVGDTITGSIPGYWMQNQTTVTSVIFANDNSVTSIGYYAFQSCTALTTITIPNSVTSIGNYVFQNCTSLATATIGTGVTSIGSYAFKSCTSLSSITIPNGVTSIAGYTFRDCTSLATVTFTPTSSATSIGDYAFQSCSALTSITIPNSVMSLGIGVFRSCTSLATATIGTGITSIGGYAFAYTGLTTITIPNSVTSLGSYAFRNCPSLNTATIGNGVAGIGSRTFLDCTSLATVTLGTSVASIGEYAFDNCTSLASINIPNSVLTINSGSFKYCTSLASVTIPNSVTSLGNYTFRGCTNLATVTIGTGLTGIGIETFRNCTSLATVTFTPTSSVASIGDYAFQDCSDLTTITIPNSVMSIGSDAFKSCTSLATVLCYVAQSAFTGSNAFYETASPLTIRVRSTDASWTAGTGLTFQGNTNVTVIKNL